MRVHDRPGRSAQNRQDALLHRVGVRIELARNHRVEVPRTRRSIALAGPRSLEHHRRHEDLRRHAPVGMKFRHALAIHLDRERHRRQHPRHRTRCQQDVAEQVAPLRARPAGDGPHVPDDEPPRGEIGGPDIEPPSLAMLGRNPLHQIRRHLRLDQLSERSGRGHRILERDRHPRPNLEDILGADARVQFLHPVIELGAEECQRSDQRPCGNAGHNVKLGPVPGIGPARQKAT